MLPPDLLIPMAVFAIVALSGAMIVATNRRGRRTLDARLKQIRTDGVALPEPEVRPNPLAELLGKVGGLSVLGGPSPKLRQTLARAGYSQRGVAELFFGIKITMLVVGVTAAILVLLQFQVSMAMGVLIVVAGAAGATMIPNFILSQKVKKRTGEIRNALPNAIDLLEVCVSAGMGVDQAWNATAEEMREASQALADEMALVNLEMLLGARRPEALKNMANRSGADDLASLSSIISQADRFGTSMADALRTFAETMRETRSQRAEESAEKMAIKLLLPMVIFIFPVVLIVSAGPAALKMIEMFSK
ncbi:MAG: type II secretion system F family protein [Phycisphaeraceae bacterium]|nr:MAG: type II secretion system F family protein [Phycisphaeraceae bacterium]